jgi:LmeA-like phospholipid-binding
MLTQNFMFGGLTGTNPPSTDWGERMLNTVASQSIRHLFSESESVEVSVRCYPSSKLLQGSIDNFKMSGRGLVIRRQFPVAEMSFETDAVSVDFSSILSGQIRLKQPTQAIAQVTLTEAGINQAFQAELVRKRLVNISLDSLNHLSGGQPVSFSEVSIQLENNNQIRILAKADLPNYGIIPISMTMTLSIERRRRLSFKNPQFEPDAVPENLREIAQNLAFTLAELLDNMVDLDRFDLDGVTLRLNRLEIQDKKLLFTGYAQIDRFPKSGQ